MLEVLCSSIEVYNLFELSKAMEGASLEICLYLTWVPSGRNQKGFSAMANVEAPKNSDFGIPISRLVNHWQQQECSCQLLPATVVQKNTSSDTVIGIRPTCTGPTHYQHLKGAAESAVS